MGFLHVGQAGLELLTLGDLPASASQRAGITVVSHHTQPVFSCFNQQYILLRGKVKLRLILDDLISEQGQAEVLFHFKSLN